MKNESSSFRDPSGQLFWHDGRLYRSITDKYIDIYTVVKESGLFERLIADNSMVAFTEQSSSYLPLPGNIALLLEPDIIPFISYPYEWSFSQLKDAAVLTLDLHLRGLKNNFLLKDASAYNIQFVNGKPIFIDHLSFDLCDNYSVWPAYGQFCRHFLSPLVLMAKVDPALSGLLKQYMDGIPLPLAAKLMPMRKMLSLGLLIHLLFHAKSQKKYEHKGAVLNEPKKLSPRQMSNMALSLKETIQNLKWKPEGTEWAEYYSDTNYSDQAMANKVQLIVDFVQKVPCRDMVWDFGGNTGDMSRAIQEHVKNIICFDIDTAAVEKNYLQIKKSKETKILPLVMDFGNPSSDMGFASRERASLTSRGKADLGMALALIHHFAISNNLPFSYVAEYFASLCNYLIIEFVPKNDSQVQRLLQSRHDIFSKYTRENFINDFSKCFEILNQVSIMDSERTIFLMKTR